MEISSLTIELGMSTVHYIWDQYQFIPGRPIQSLLINENSILEEKEKGEKRTRKTGPFRLESS